MESSSARQVPRSLEEWLTLERALESLAGLGQHWSPSPSSSPYISISDALGLDLDNLLDFQVSR